MMDPRWLAGWSRRVKPDLADVCNKDSEQMITSVHSFVATVDLIIALKDWQSRPHDADNTWRQLRTKKKPCTSSDPSGGKRCASDSIAIFPNFLVCLKVQKTKERNRGFMTDWDKLSTLCHLACPWQIWLISRKLFERKKKKKGRLRRNYNLQSKQMKAKQKGWVIWIKGLGSSFLFITFRLLAISTDHDAGAAWAWPSFSVYIVKPRRACCPAPWRTVLHLVCNESSQEPLSDALRGIRSNFKMWTTDWYWSCIAICCSDCLLLRNLCSSGFQFSALIHAI